MPFYRKKSDCASAAMARASTGPRVLISKAMARAAPAAELKTQDLNFIQELAQQLRVDGIRMSTNAGSGHPTSSMSAADLMAVLLARHLQYDWGHPKEPNNDHLIFSKGHASPLLYALFKAAGAISDEELLTFRRFGSRLEGHPTPAGPCSDVATRKAYGDALLAVGKARADVVALDGEVSNSTYAEEFAKEIPERYFEMYISECQLAAAAVGLQVRGWKPFGSTFAAFLSRAYDFIRMAAISRANIRLSGSHAGVSIGEDGPSQM